MKKNRFYMFMSPELKARIEAVIEKTQPKFRSVAHYLEVAASEKIEREKGYDKRND